VIATRQQIGRSGRSKQPIINAARQPGVSYAAAAATPPSPASAVIPSEKAPVATQESDDSFLGVAREIIAEDGVAGLWLGIKPGLVLTVNPAITYGAFERIKGTLLASSPETKLAPGMAFVVGAFSKTLATIVCLVC
jgi:adenine nucleotide transporter 17